MGILYNLLYAVFIIICLPVYLFKGKFHKGFSRRFGALPKDLSLDKPIWVHAVSVGEAMAVAGLIDELRKIYPEKRFVISTVTATGNKIAQKIAKENDFVTYLPLDFSCVVRKVVDKINPQIFIIAETEIWPNLISYLSRKGIPIITVNGRISDSSFRGYRFFRSFIAKSFKKVNLFCVQAERDAERLKELGVEKEKIKVSGNMKFDFSGLADKTKVSCDKYKSLLKLKPGTKLLVAGSTHPGEEEILLSAYKKLLTRFPSLRLLFAPRHPERSAKVRDLVLKYGFSAYFVSKSYLTPQTSNLTPIFILDTVGELINFYSLADIVYVGGSLVKKGGHNIIEPAIFSKPILFGPHMFNFRDIAQMFLDEQAGIMVANGEALESALKKLLDDPSQQVSLGQCARALIIKNQGATKRNAGYIADFLKS